MVTSLGTVLEKRKDENFHLVDARPANRYNGIEDEPSGIPGGNIPGTINIPFKKFMTKHEDSPFQTFRSEEEIEKIFKDNHVDLSQPVIATCSLVKQLGEALTKFPKNLRVLDSSWHPPAAERDPYAEFIEGHIPGALFFDLEECRDKSSKYDHMLPSPAEFEDYVGHLGINNDTHVVVYENDATGLYSSPRAWWNFRVFGHHSVSILNGGFPRWIAEGRPVSKELHSVKKEIFKAQFNPKMVTSLGTVLEKRKDENFHLVDARSANRFNGIEDEPSGIPGGNIPGTINIPFKKFVTKIEDSPFQTFRSEEEIEKIFKDNKVDLSQPVIATCSLGITACTIALAAFQLGKKDVPVYDGSWMEYYDKIVKKREE